MRDPLTQDIAKHLADSNVGLFRKQLFEKIPADLTGGDANQISSALNIMLNAGHVAKSPRQGLNGSRRSLTPKGRSAYSVLNEPDEPIKTEAATDRDQDDERDDYLPEHLIHQASAPDPTLEFLDNHKIDSAFLKFDTTDTLDRALYGLVKLIRDSAEQPTIAIERKAEKLALLERMENNDLLPGNTRALLAYIRMDLEQLDEIA